MDQNFQTSFIPKRPMIEERATPARSVGVFTIISIFIFFTILLTSGGLYFYKGVLTKNLAKMDNDLTLAHNRFEPSKIAQLQVLDKRLKAATEVLDNHVTISPIFKTLEGVTQRTVRYTKFNYNLDTEKGTKVSVKLSGMATGYRAIALQSDLFAKEKQFIDPVFSNLSLNNNGNVLFDLEFSVDPSFVDYKQTLETQSN